MWVILLQLPHLSGKYYLRTLTGSLYIQMRQNLGLNGDNSPPAAESSELVPPLRILAPWGFKVSLQFFLILETSLQCAKRVIAFLSTSILPIRSFKLDH